MPASASPPPAPRGGTSGRAMAMLAPAAPGIERRRGSRSRTWRLTGSRRMSPPPASIDEDLEGARRPDEGREHAHADLRTVLRPGPLRERRGPKQRKPWTEHAVVCVPSAELDGDPIGSFGPRGPPAVIWRVDPLRVRPVASPVAAPPRALHPDSRWLLRRAFWPFWVAGD